MRVKFKCRKQPCRQCQRLTQRTVRDGNPHPPPRLVKVTAARMNENLGLPISFNFLPQRCSTGTCHLCSSPLCPSLSNRRRQSKAAHPGKSGEEPHALPFPLPVLCPKVCNWPLLSPETKAVLHSSVARFDIWVEACLEGILTTSHGLVSSSAIINRAAENKRQTELVFVQSCFASRLGW